MYCVMGCVLSLVLERLLQEALVKPGQSAGIQLCPAAPSIPACDVSAPRVGFATRGRSYCSTNTEQQHRGTEGGTEHIPNCSRNLPFCRLFRARVPARGMLLKGGEQGEGNQVTAEWLLCHQASSPCSFLDCQKPSFKVRF